MGEPEALRGVEGVWDREPVVDGAEHNGVCLSSRGNEREVEMNAQDRRNRSGAHRDEQEVLNSVQGDWRRQSKGKGDLRSGRQG